MKIIPSKSKSLYIMFDNGSVVEVIDDGKQPMMIIDSDSKIELTETKPDGGKRVSEITITKKESKEDEP